MVAVVVAFGPEAGSALAVALEHLAVVPGLLEARPALGVDRQAAARTEVARKLRSGPKHPGNKAPALVAAAAEEGVRTLVAHTVAVDPGSLHSDPEHPAVDVGRWVPARPSKLASVAGNHRKVQGVHTVLGTLRHGSQRVNLDGKRVGVGKVALNRTLWKG